MCSSLPLTQEWWDSVRVYGHECSVRLCRKKLPFYPDFKFITCVLCWKPPCPYIMRKDELEHLISPLVPFPTLLLTSNWKVKSSENIHPESSLYSWFCTNRCSCSFHVPSYPSELSYSSLKRLQMNRMSYGRTWQNVGRWHLIDNMLVAALAPRQSQASEANFLPLCTCGIWNWTGSAPAGKIWSCPLQVDLWH